MYTAARPHGVSTYQITRRYHCHYFHACPQWTFAYYKGPKPRKYLGRVVGSIIGRLDYVFLTGSTSSVPKMRSQKRLVTPKPFS